MENIPSQAAQILIAIVPLAGIAFGGGIIFFYLLWSYREKMEMIRHSITPPKTPYRFICLLGGLVLAFVGFTITLFFILKSGFDYALLGGLLPLSTGISLLLFYYITGKTHRNGKT